MDPTNQTAISEFLLLGLTEDPALQSLIFSLFHPICLVTILGNLLIILAIYSDSHLHTPMYFFLCNLSFNDICISMTTIPKMLVNILTGDQSITNTGCLTQDAFVMLFSYWDNFLFAVMAYDRYVAICPPLRIRLPSKLPGLRYGECSREEGCVPVGRAVKLGMQRKREMKRWHPQGVLAESKANARLEKEGVVRLAISSDNGPDQEDKKLSAQESLLS
ncbi:Olfactory receptor 7G2 [Sciurus carolinensis]|uniref:Olfactory receptor 7G2 n=1 Tax=Sciurus carolinensis TaxID=30640 RepID=A0AA41N7J9_SCICA|nr:Olfactory receptor 7G2 [Sciurus carolinensis]